VCVCVLYTYIHTHIHTLLQLVLWKCITHELITSGFFSRPDMATLGGGVSSELWATATDGTDTEFVACWDTEEPCRPRRELPPVGWQSMYHYKLLTPDVWPREVCDTQPSAEVRTFQALMPSLLQFKANFKSCNIFSSLGWKFLTITSERFSSDVKWQYIIMHNTYWTVISINLHKLGNDFYIVREIKTHAMPSQIVRI